MQSFQEQHITTEWNCKIDIHYIYRIKELFKKLPIVKGEYVSSVFICPKKDSIYLLIKSKRP